MCVFSTFSLFFFLFTYFFLLFFSFFVLPLNRSVQNPSWCADNKEYKRRNPLKNERKRDLDRFKMTLSRKENFLYIIYTLATNTNANSYYKSWKLFFYYLSVCPSTVLDVRHPSKCLRFLSSRLLKFLLRTRLHSAINEWKRKTRWSRGLCKTICREIKKPFVLP